MSKSSPCPLLKTMPRLKAGTPLHHTEQQLTQEFERLGKAQFQAQRQQETTLLSYLKKQEQTHNTAIEKELINPARQRIEQGHSMTGFFALRKPQIEELKNRANSSHLRESINYFETRLFLSKKLCPQEESFSEALQKVFGY